MILEGIVTTVSADGVVNIAPMGPRVDPEMNHLELRPFRTARTYANLQSRGEGVFHVVDDVLLLARAAVGRFEKNPAFFPATAVRGQVLHDACRYYEFRIISCDDRSERVVIGAEVVHRGRLRDFFGLNRAKHAVVEAAILATRTEFLAQDVILAEIIRLTPLVEKTGGQREFEAFAFLKQYIQEKFAKKAENGPEASPAS